MDSQQPEYVSDAFDFEEHVPGRISKLEIYRRMIAKMRERSWPYQRIAKWLDQERGLTISGESVRSFCLVRGIRKGLGESLREHRKSPARCEGNPRAATDQRPPTTAIVESEKEDDDGWDLVVPKFLETWKSRGEEQPDT